VNRIIISSTLFALFSFVVVLRAAPPDESAPSGPMVQIQQGKIRGASEADGTLVFQAIPYAAPPVAEFRWKPPRPSQSWDGARDATKSSPSCMQVDWGWNAQDAKDGSEDCLYLNVVTPSLHPQHAIPVIFWIHGGANYNGSGRYFKGQTLTSHGVVLVSINYRLGVFGFLAHPQLTAESAQHSSGNYAILDQIAALEWVKNNISQFGGDPSNVTIAGQSAGAMNVGVLLATPASKGLFARAIAESGGPIGPFPKLPTLAQGEALGQELAKSAGIPAGLGEIAALRSMSAKDVLDLTQRFTAPDVEGVPTRQGPSTVVDGVTIPSQPVHDVRSGSVHRVPLLIGSNIQEFSFGRSSTISKESEPAEELKKRIDTFYGNEAPSAASLYGLKESDHPNSDPLLGSVGTQLMTDVYFRCPATITARWLSDKHFAVWQYQFERPLPGTGASSTRHSGELPYVFGWAQHVGASIMGATFGADDSKVSDQIQTYWTNFARTGDPNGPALPRWSEATSNRANLMRFSSSGPKPDLNSRLEVCSAYESHLHEAIP